MTGFSAEVVDQLPADGGQAGVIYLLANTQSEQDNAYKEYMRIGGKWELIGTTAVDLSDYIKISDLTPITNTEIEAVFNAAEG